MTSAGADSLREWAFLGRRVLVVSRFPPAPGGIVRYAGQLVEALAPGREVVRLGTPEGGGDRVIALRGGMRALRLLAHGRGFDDIVVMYHPHHFVCGGLVNRTISYACWAVVARLRRLTVVVHEPDDPRPAEIGRRGRAGFWLEERLRRALWRGTANLVFHTDFERHRFAERFPPGRGRTDRLVTHGSFFVPGTGASRGEARGRLGLASDRVLLLCIGFLSCEKPDKGYERAVHAVRRAGLPDVDLHIVGSPIRPDPSLDRYVVELRRLAAKLPSVHLHERFVGDEEFDLWIRAADAVLTPYRDSSSSSVAARTHLLGTTLITSGVGGMAEQLRPGDVVFGSDEELVEAIRRLAAGRRPMRPYRRSS